MKQKIFLYINISLIAFLALGGAVLAFGTWAAPTADPPGDNADLPLNVGGAAQTKDGGLNLGFALSATDTGLNVVNGKVVIGDLVGCDTIDTNASGGLVCGTDRDTDTDGQILSANSTNGTMSISNGNTVDVTAKNLALGGFTGGSGGSTYLPMWNSDGHSLGSSNVRNDLSNKKLYIEADAVIDGTLSFITGGASGRSPASTGNINTLGKIRSAGGFCITSDMDCVSSWSIGSILAKGNDAGRLDITNVRKITADLYDPVYTINGRKYATYLPSMTGVKEETAGLFTLVDGKYVIDLNALAEGSDLWLFSKATNLKNNFDNLIVSLTPSFDGRVWYEKDPLGKKITFYGSKDGEVSYRLTAPRFDSDKWSNYSDEIEVTGLIIND